MAIIFCIHIISLAGGLTIDQGDYVTQLYFFKKLKTGELSLNYVNFTLLNWEVWKVVNNISQKPKNTFKWHYWWWYMCVCVCVCVCSDWVALFKICPIQGFNVSGLQVTKSRSKGFWNERVTVKKLQDRTNQMSKHSAYQRLWMAGPNRHSRESSSRFERVTGSCAKSTQWREQFKVTFLGTDLPLNFSN